MTPQSCLTCKHWHRHRPDADWGGCTKITNVLEATRNGVKAYIHVDEPATGVLHTHKTFECAHYESQNRTDNTLVDHLVEATRAAHGYPPRKQ